MEIWLHVLWTCFIWFCISFRSHAGGSSLFFYLLSVSRSHSNGSVLIIYFWTRIYQPAYIRIHRWHCDASARSTRFAIDADVDDNREKKMFFSLLNLKTLWLIFIENSMYIKWAHWSHVLKVSVSSNWNTKLIIIPIVRTVQLAYRPFLTFKSANAFKKTTITWNLERKLLTHKINALWCRFFIKKRKTTTTK